MAGDLATRVDQVSPRTRRGIGYALLALLAYVPLLLTAPGKVAADTKQYLYLDPGRLMSRAWSMWDPNIGFGTVTHQNIGYLFPMGPFYWVLDAIGIPDWVSQRFWLGTILLFAGLGMLYLLRTLDVRGPGAPVGALAFMLSPYLLGLRGAHLRHPAAVGRPAVVARVHDPRVAARRVAVSRPLRAHGPGGRECERDRARLRGHRAAPVDPVRDLGAARGVVAARRARPC